MMFSKVLIREPVLVNVPEIVPGVYKLTPEARWPWLQRVLLWGLKKLGAEYSRLREETRYSEIRFDLDKIVEATWKHVLAVRRKTGRRVEYLLMGPDQAGILFNAILNQPQALTIPRDYQAPLAGWDGAAFEFAGVTVIVIPWMVGVLAVPEGFIGDRGNAGGPQIDPPKPCFRHPKCPR